MICSHLSKENQTIVCAMFGDREFDDVFLRFWDSETLQIDGDVDIDDLKFFLSVMEAISQ